MFWMEFPGARLPSWIMSITCTTVAPTPTIVTAITVASRKPSLRTAAMNPRTPEGEVHETHLLLERTPRRPIDRFRDDIGREDMTEEAAEPSPGDPEHEQHPSGALSVRPAASTEASASSS